MDGAAFGAAAFRLALTYLYTGELRTEEEGAPRPSEAGVEPLRPTSRGVARLLELLQLADYFELAHLKQLGERLVVEWEVLQVENVVHIYSHAAACHCAQLRASCVQFIRGMFDVVRQTDAYAGLSPALQQEVQSIR